jgi:hypothetical protein
VISSGRALLADAMPRGPITTAEALLAMADRVRSRHSHAAAGRRPPHRERSHHVQQRRGHRGSRQQAVDRLRKRSKFWTHLAGYLLVNDMLVAVIRWSTRDGSSGRSSRWPAGVVCIGLFFNSMDALR